MKAKAAATLLSTMSTQQHMVFTGLDAANNYRLYVTMQGESYPAQCSAYKPHLEYPIIDIELDCRRKV
jgi:hypothetical protein